MNDDDCQAGSLGIGMVEAARRYPETAAQALRQAWEDKRAARDERDRAQADADRLRAENAALRHLASTVEAWRRADTDDDDAWHGALAAIACAHDALPMEKP